MERDRRALPMPSLHQNSLLPPKSAILGPNRARFEGSFRQYSAGFLAYEWARRHTGLQHKEGPVLRLLSLEQVLPTDAMLPSPFHRFGHRALLTRPAFAAP